MVDTTTKTVRTRMAPSPTGKLHLGTAYATLWPYLFARHNHGQFILRIEDTDLDRSTKEFAENIIDSLKWLGYEWDEGPYYQMERLNIYQAVAEKLLTEGKAYRCFCTKEDLEKEKRQQIENNQPQVYSGKCRSLIDEEVRNNLKSNKPFVIRYKLPHERGMVIFDDMIHGRVEIDSNLLGDMIIVRQNGIPLYNFVVVVDDVEMNISHVIRGDDHISNTPKQILFFEALDKNPPQFGHYPVILNQDRSGKLSKRTGSTAVADYRSDGYLPEAIISYLTLLGWASPVGKEILSLPEIIKVFDIKDMNKAAAAWSSDKLDWVNGEYIRMMSDEDLTKRLINYLNELPVQSEEIQEQLEEKKVNKHQELPKGTSEEVIRKLVPLIKERIKKLSDFIPLTAWIFDKAEYDLGVFARAVADTKIVDPAVILKKVLEKFEQIEKPWQKEVFEQTFQDLAKELELNNTQVFQLIRVAVSGQLITPPLFESIEILGEDETINRIKGAISFLSELK